jgi:TRAP-type uncharacterized transport system fused permease subunit
MAEENTQPALVAPVIDEAALKKAEEFIEAEEGATHRFKGAWGTFLLIVAVAMSLFHLYAASEYITTTTLRYVHVGFDATATSSAGLILLARCSAWQL